LWDKIFQGNHFCGKVFSIITYSPYQKTAITIFWRTASSHTIFHLFFWQELTNIQPFPRLSHSRPLGWVAQFASAAFMGRLLVGCKIYRHPLSYIPKTYALTPVELGGTICVCWFYG